MLKKITHEKIAETDNKRMIKIRWTKVQTLSGLRTKTESVAKDFYLDGFPFACHFFQHCLCGLLIKQSLLTNDANTQREQTSSFGSL